MQKKSVIDYWLYFVTAASVLVYIPVYFYFNELAGLPTHFENGLKFSAFLVLFFIAVLKYDPGRLKTEHIDYWVYGVILIYGTYLFHVTWFGYHSFSFGVFDFSGISTVAASIVTSGRFLDSPFYTAGNGSGFFPAHHFSPVILLFSPFYLFFNNHIVYGFLLNIIYLLFLLVLYKLLNLYFKKPCAVVLFTGLLNYTFFHDQSISYHYEILVLLFSVSWFYFRKNEQAVLQYMFLFLLFLTKEDISLYVSFLGLFFLTSKKNRQEGVILVSLGFLYFLLINKVVIPWLSGEHESRFVQYWSFGETLPGLVIYLATHPGFILNAFAAKWRILYSIYIPLLLIPLFNVRYTMLVLFPLTAMHFVSSHVFFGTIAVYYSYTILPFILYGLLDNLTFVSFIKSKQLVIVLLVFTVIMAIASRKKNLPYFSHKRNGPDPSLELILQKIEPGKPVHADSFLLSHIPVRNPAYFTTDMRFTPDYFLFKKDLTPVQFDHAADLQALEKTVRLYGNLVVTSGPYELYRIPAKFTKTIRNFNCIKLNDLDSSANSCSDE